MFAALLLLLCCAEDDRCPFNDPPSAVGMISGMGSGSRNYLSIIGTPNSEWPGYDGLTGDGLMDYLLSVVGFGIPFIVIFVFFFLTCLCHGVFCWCPCCRRRPKNPDTDMCYRIKMVIHLASSGLIVISAIIFFVACGNVSSALSRLVGLGDVVHTEMGSVWSTVSGASSQSFRVIHGLVDDTERTLRDFITWLDTNNTHYQAEAEGVLRPNSTLDLYEQINETAGWIDAKGDIESWLPSAPEVLRVGFERQERSVGPALEVVRRLMRDLIDATDDISTTVKEANDSLTVNIRDVNVQVDSYETGDLQTTLRDFQDNIDSITSQVDSLAELLSEYRSLIELGIYLAITLLLVIAIAYAVFWFFKGCPTRCLALCFPWIALLLTFIIILPCVVFAAIFFVFDDMCPELEDTAAEALKGYVDAASVHDLLNCPIKRPLLDILDLDFNYNDLIDEVADKAKAPLSNSFTSDKVDTRLGSFGNGFDVERNMSSENVHFNYTNVLHDIAYHPTSDDDVKKGAGHLKKAIDKADTDYLDYARKTVSGIVGFGKEVSPRSSTTSERVHTLVEDFRTDGKKTLGDAVNTLTCETSKCIYAPVKNALCTNIRGAFAFWIQSTIILMVGLLVQWILWICLRRTLSPERKIEALSDKSPSAEDSPDARHIVEFQPSGLPLDNYDAAPGAICEPPQKGDLPAPVP